MNQSPERFRKKAARALRIYFERKRSPRMMLSLVILLTGLAGFCISAGLLQLGMTGMWARYPLAVFGAYAFFLGLVRIWVELERQHFNADDPVLQAALKEPAYDEPAAAIGDKQSRHSWLDALDVPTLDEGCLPALLLGAIVALILVLISALGAAPVLIAEVFVDAALTGLLYRRLKIAYDEHWLGTAIGKTWVHVLLAALALAVIGFCLDLMAPNSDTLGQAVKELFGIGGGM